MFSTLLFNTDYSFRFSMTSVHSCLILDDNLVDLHRLHQAIRQLTTLTLVAVVDDPAAALTVLQASRVDLLLVSLDLIGVNSFDWLRSLSYPPRVIGFSSSPAQAWAAYEVGIVDYLLKPYTVERLALAIGRALGQPNVPVPTVVTQRAEVTQLMLHDQSGRVPVLLADIRYITAQGSGSIVTTGEKQWVVQESLGMIQARLPANQFVRVNKSNVVAMSKISRRTDYSLWVDSIEIKIGQVYRRALDAIRPVGSK